jgi:hypothetical protein
MPKNNIINIVPNLTSGFIVNNNKKTIKEIAQKIEVFIDKKIKE